MRTKQNRRRLYSVRLERWMKVKDPASIRRWRKQKRYSQAELADLCGRRSQNTIHLNESGKMKTLSEDLALDIAARLDVPWEDLFELETSTPVPVATNAVRTTRNRTEQLAS